MLKRILYIINMGFFDLKLIIIIALTIICYFIYKELLHINKKINYVYSRLINFENNYHVSNGDMPLNIEKEINVLEDIDMLDNKQLRNINNKIIQKNIEPKQVNNQVQQIIEQNQVQQNIEQNQVQQIIEQNQVQEINNEQFIITQNELNKLNDEYMMIQNELRNLPKDLSEDINIIFNQISMVPLHIPFNFNNRSCEVLPEIEEVSNESLSENYGKNINFEEFANKSEQENNNQEQENNNQEQENNNQEQINYDEEENKTYEILKQSETSSEESNTSTSKKSSSSKKSSNSKKSNSSKKSSSSSKKNNTQELDSETSQNRVTTPLEEFSNDNNDNKEIVVTPQNVETKLQINESKLENILKNLNKYKLPELQDIAIEYKLGLQLNGKNKNKNQLLNDIKNFILNKNI